MLASTDELSIDIPGGGPFGFKLQGGKEYMTPLVILSMSPGGKALIGGLKEGDVLIGINKAPTYGLRHPEALKLVKAAKDGLNLSVIRGLNSRDESLEAMRRYSEDPVECLPPPPCDDGLPPPPPDLYDLPPPPPANMPIPPPSPTGMPIPPPPPPPPVKAPPPPVKAPPPIKTPAAIKAAKATSQAKAASQVKVTSQVKVGTPPAPKCGPPPMASNGESPKSILSQFGGEITERAKQRETNPGQNGNTKRKTGRYFKILQEQIEEFKAGETDEMEPAVNKTAPLGVTSPIAKVPTMSPKADQPKAEPIKSMPATNISLLNMTYTPGKSSKTSPSPRPSKVSPKDPLAPPPASPAPPKPVRAKTQDNLTTPASAKTHDIITTPVRAKSQDVITIPAHVTTQDIAPVKSPVDDEAEVQLTPSELKKRFEKPNDQVKPSTFANKGSFYSRFPTSPVTPPPDKTPVSPNITKEQSPTNAPKPFSSTPPTTPKSYSPPFSSKPSPVTTSYAGPKPATPSPKTTTPTYKNFKSTPVRPKPKEITPPPSPDPVPKTIKPIFAPQFSYNSTYSSSPKSLDSPPSFHKSRNSSSSSSGSDKKNPVRPNMVSLLDGLTVNNDASSPPKPISEPAAHPKQPSSLGASSPKSTSPMSTSSSSSSEKKPLIAPKTLLLPICKTCNSEIRGPYVGAQGRAWHAEHFVCGLCKGDLSDGFKEVEDMLHCGDCYFNTHGDKCAKCGEIIMGSAVEALGNTYHPDHFTCTKCDAPFSGGFNVNEGDPYCQSCYNKIFMPNCAGCGETIEGITEWISALEKNWHNGCFVCSTCKAPLGGKTFYQKNGQAVCQQHAKGP